MHRIEPVLARMLDDAGQPRQQPGDAKPDHHAQNDADVREDVVGVRELLVH